jgi:transcriptional/translational regulatory protein YebC/TACO1
MIFNLNPSPKYTLIRVNGKLTFDNTTDTHLRAKHIFIRAGELHIGSEEYPYLPKGRITLYGEKGAETMVYDNAIEAGNKLIANVGIFRIYAKPRLW